MALTNLLLTSGIDYEIRKFMNDRGDFKYVDELFDKGDTQGAAHVLKKSLRNACEKKGRDYNFNYSVMKSMIGGLLLNF